MTIQLLDVMILSRQGWFVLIVEQGLKLWNHCDLSEIAHLAHICKTARVGDDVFFNSNLHVNQTNICTLACKFCAFRRGPKAKDAYALDQQQFIDRIPLKRLGDPQEIADCVAFLASDQASYITGQAIQVNGGIFFG